MKRISRRRFLAGGATLALGLPIACSDGGASPRQTASAPQPQPAPSRPLVPRIDGDWWTIAVAPDLGPLGSARDIEVVDFTLWQAADASWQVQSCIRGTRAGGQGRLLYRWQGTSLLAPDWRPMGITMQADPSLGETIGGLQAPFVLRLANEWRLFYGDWTHICQASSRDGKTFERLVSEGGRTGIFDEGQEANARDPMVLRVGDEWIAYYTAHPGGRGAVYARRSPDLRSWGPSRIVAAGGSAGDGPFAAECPFVRFVPEAGAYFLFRTQRYGAAAETRVYRSPDPFDFGIDDDRHLVATLPLAAPELVDFDGQTYIASLLPDLKGIRVARLEWGEERGNRN